MTLIVTAATHNGVLMASDRMVSVGLTPFDAAANKALLLVAPTMVAAIGYTGIAYIDGVPTDQWLAEVLVGKPRGWLQGGFKIDGRFTFPQTPGRLVWLIHKELHQLASTRRDKWLGDNWIQIVVAGIDIQRWRFRPFLSLVGVHKGSTSAWHNHAPTGRLKWVGATHNDIARRAAINGTRPVLGGRQTTAQPIPPQVVFGSIPSINSRLINKSEFKKAIHTGDLTQMQFVRG